MEGEKTRPEGEHSVIDTVRAINLRVHEPS